MMPAGYDVDDGADAPPLLLSSCALSLALEDGRISAGLVTRLGEVVSAQRVPVSAGADAGELLRVVGAVLDSVLHAAGVEPDRVRALPGIGVSVAGRLDRDAGTVTPSGLAAWKAFPLRDTLIGRFALPIRTLTEPLAVTIGEHWRGAARGRRNVLGVMLGDAVGGGVLVDGRLVNGTTGNAGHIGHVSVDPFGPRCYCGGRGCLEMVAGAPAISTWARSHGHPDPTVTAAGVAEAAQRGEPVALATFRRAGEAVGMAVAGAVTLLDLDVVVIGGPVAAAGGSLLFDAIGDGYARYAALGYAQLPRTVPALLGADSALIGAAAAVLAPETYPTG